MRTLCILPLLLLTGFTWANPQSPTLTLSALAWQGLAQDEQNYLQRKHVIETVAADSFGVIIDNQGIDQSTPGTQVGAALGSTVAGAAYIDRAFRGNHHGYSALAHLGVAIIGGVVGSALDRGPRNQYYFRYAIRLGNGSVVYQDTVASTPFRHPIGVCVDVPAMTVHADQRLCEQSADTLRATYLGKKKFEDARAEAEFVRDGTVTPVQVRAPTGTLVTCKPALLAPMQTTAEKCEAMRGTIYED